MIDLGPFFKRDDRGVTDTGVLRISYFLSSLVRPLPEEPRSLTPNDDENYEESRAADLDQLYATVDKTQTRAHKSKAHKKKLEMEAVLFKAKVG